MVSLSPKEPRPGAKRLLTFEVCCVLFLAFFAPKLGEEAMNTVKLTYFPLLPFIAMLWLWGVNVMVWDMSDVNYIEVIEEKDRSAFPTHGTIFRMGHACTCTVLANIVIFTTCSLWGFTTVAESLPRFLYFILLFALLLPGSWFFGKHRQFFVKTLYQIIVPLDGRVSFSQFLLADVLTSLARPMTDIGLAGCHFLKPYTSIGNFFDFECNRRLWLFPCILSLPYLWRFVQCVKIHYSTGATDQLANAFKYFTALPVIYFGSLKHRVTPEEWAEVYKIFWVACIVLNSLFSYYWDIAKDWELGLFSPGKEKMLREDLLYSSPAWYYLAATTNLFLRVGWTLELALEAVDISGRGLTLLICLMEVMRRFQWMFFRIEVALLKTWGDIARELELLSPKIHHDLEA